jgi:hypothetical protein
MKFAVAILALLTLSGCSADTSNRLPTVPSPPPAIPPTSSSGIIWVMVIEERGPGICIPGATIQTVGQSGEVGERITQEPCAVWDYAGGVELKGLTSGVEVKLRGSAPGYVTRDQSFLPNVGSFSAVFIELSREQSK